MRRWLAFALMLGAGCNDAPGPGPITPGEARDVCTKSCGYDVDCEDGDLETCVDDCVVEVGTWARHDAIATIASCRDQLSCDDDSDTCLERVKPLAFHRRFQDACRAGLDGCADVDLDLDCAIEYSPDGDDIGYFRFMSEPVIDELTACFEAADCAARTACLDEVYLARGISL
jgi:hypothetical protein